MNDNSIILNENVGLANLGDESVIIHYLMDSEGTLFLQYDPTEMLGNMEDRDLYFLAHPKGKPDMIKRKLQEISKRSRYGLMEIVHNLDAAGKNMYEVCDILADEWLKLEGLTPEQITEKRSAIEVKMRKWNDPRIIERLTKKYPGLKITVFTETTPADYMRSSYNETLKNTGAGLIIAPGYQGSSYRKMDSRLYRLVKENEPGDIKAFIDDNEARIPIALEGGIDFARYYAAKDGEDLYDASVDVLNQAYKRR